MTDNVMLTTIDNPYNPHHDFDKWRAFDEGKGYYSCAYLARLAPCSDSLSDKENLEIINQAIQDIIDFDPIGIYIRITPDITPPAIDINKSHILDTEGGL